MALRLKLVSSLALALLCVTSFTARMPEDLHPHVCRSRLQGSYHPKS